MPSSYYLHTDEIWCVKSVHVHVFFFLLGGVISLLVSILVAVEDRTHTASLRSVKAWVDFVLFV